MTLADSLSFDTYRLRTQPWQRLLAGHQRASLITDTLALLNPAVTRNLPPGWSAVSTAEQADAWLAERDAESQFLAVSGREDGRMIGCVFLHEMSPGARPAELRLGYLLAESTWGKGMGTELLRGLVERARASGAVASITGGVERDNPASIRVMEKVGFARDTGDESADPVFLSIAF